MFRLRGVSAEIREIAGPAATDAFAILTRLGDPVFLLALIAIYYWLSEKREAPVRLIAFTLLAVALTVSLKNGLALPRPPPEVQDVAEYSESYGFPSGHALGATVVYGGFVLVDERLRRPGAVLAAPVLVACIGLSRVVIGVHYLGDVLAGFAVGGVVLASLWYSTSRHRLLVAGLATLVAVPAVAVTGGGADSTFVLGSCLGAVAVFAMIDTASLPVARSVGASSLLVGVGAAVLGAAYTIASAVDHPVAFVAGGGVILSGSLLLPLVLRFGPVRRVVAD